jgi:hypothetical protein
MIMQRLAFFVLFLAVASVTADASPSGDFQALLDKHWATANREQVYFRTDPDAWRMHGKRRIHYRSTRTTEKLQRYGPRQARTNRCRGTA